MNLFVIVTEYGDITAPTRSRQDAESQLARLEAKGIQGEVTQCVSYLDVIRMRKKVEANV